MGMVQNGIHLHSSSHQGRPIATLGCVSLAAIILSGCGAINLVESSAGSSGPASPIPTITVQPANTTVMLGNTAMFSVTATGSGPISFQWRKNSAKSPRPHLPPTRPRQRARLTTHRHSTWLFPIPREALRVTPQLSAFPLLFRLRQVTMSPQMAATARRVPSPARLPRCIALNSHGAILHQGNSDPCRHLLSRQPLTLTSLDRGETWEAAPGATVVLSGGEVLAGWASEGNGVYSTNAAKPIGLDLAIAGVRQLPAALATIPNGRLSPAGEYCPPPRRRTSV